MTHSLSIRWLVALTLVAAFAVPAQGDVVIIDYYGYGWETGGIPPSNAGDMLYFTGAADDIDPAFGVDLGTEEVTFYCYDLTSTGEVPVGGGTVMIGYTGGMLDIYRDAAKNADWGTFPPNATSPSTFVDGTLLFQGSFMDFTLFLDSTGGGAYQGNLDGLGGEILGSPCANCGFTWGGSFTSPSGAQIPDGYDLQMDGVFEIDRAIGTKTTGWGQLKALFGN
jgi:hypothetical protein